MKLALLVASAVEAFFLLMLLGYGSLYLRVAWHTPDVVASLAAAGPALATFLGSTFWGHRLWRMGVRQVALVGLAGYMASALIIFFASGPWVYIVGVMVSSLISSALAPVTLTLLTHQGGDMGRRLADRLKWQSSGWMVGGLLGGYLASLSHRSYPELMAILGMLMIGAAVGVLRAEPFRVTHDPAESRGHLSTGLLVLLVLPFFLAYAGNEGFFTNFSLYLHAVGVTPAWVGWSAAVSTGLGWIMASSIGRWTDRIGGKTLLLRVLMVYAGMYLVMSLASSEIIVIVAFSLPLYPFLNIGIQRAVAESLPGTQHGSAMGLINGASGLATFSGGLLMGTVNSGYGARAMPWAAVALVAVGLVAALVIYRSRHRLETV